MPWLMKAEPDSRIEKGKDVKFSVDDFEKIGVSPWDGVRSHEAKAIMRDRMKLGDKVLFYHSNCKVPGVYALAEVAKEGYPDHTAWDPSHPYYDPKSKEDSPTWFMVSVRFLQRIQHPVTLAFIKHLATLSTLPPEIDYIGKEGLQAITSMQLINRGRLSVQPVSQVAYDAVVLLGTEGGWEELLPTGSKAKTKGDESKSNGKPRAKIDSAGGEDDKPETNGKAKRATPPSTAKEAAASKRKRKTVSRVDETHPVGKGDEAKPAKEPAAEEEVERRRSKRVKR